MMEQSPEDAASVSQAVASEILTQAAANVSGDFRDELRDALNTIPDLPEEARNRVYEQLARELPSLPSACGAGYLAICLGARVERGHSPDLSIIPVRDTLLKWVRTINTNQPDQGKGESPVVEQDETTLFGIQLLGQSLVAHLAKSPDRYAEMLASSEVIEELARVEHDAIGAKWVLHLLRLRSGNLIVIHAEAGKGVRVAYENVANCFHLFTLLQGAIHQVMPGSRTPDSNVLAEASHGEGKQVADEAWWHYGQPGAKVPQLESMVFGEAGPDSIGQIDKQQVLLLWKPVLQSRSWDSGFFNPVMHAKPPAVKLLGELDAKEMSSWWLKLGFTHSLPKAAVKPWWKRW